MAECSGSMKRVSVKRADPEDRDRSEAPVRVDPAVEAMVVAVVTAADLDPAVDPAALDPAVVAPAADPADLAPAAMAAGVASAIVLPAVVLLRGTSARQLAPVEVAAAATRIATATAAVVVTTIARRSGATTTTAGE